MPGMETRRLLAIDHSKHGVDDGQELHDAFVQMQVFKACAEKQRRRVTCDIPSLVPAQAPLGFGGLCTGSARFTITIEAQNFCCKAGWGGHKWRSCDPRTLQLS